MSCLTICVLFSQCSLFTAEHGHGQGQACPGWLRPLVYTGHTASLRLRGLALGWWLTLALIMLWLLSQSRGGDTQSGLQLAWLVT